MAAFRPRMSAAHHGISVVGEPRAHASSLGLMEVWRARCEEGASGDYVSLDPRLFIVLEPLDAEIAFDGVSGDLSASRAPSVSFVPAGTPLHLRVSGATEMRHLDLHFDASQFEGLDAAATGAPRLMFADERMQRLARLFEDACEASGEGAGLLGDGLQLALISATFAPAQDFPSRRSALSDRQLRQAVDYIEAHCAEPIRLKDLADAAGLSETYFSHAFKAATGTPPHRWQLQARIRRAQAMLLKSDMSLIEIAGALGFADQPHFTKVFRSHVGVTPASWRASRIGKAPE